MIKSSSAFNITCSGQNLLQVIMKRAGKCCRVFIKQQVMDIIFPFPGLRKQDVHNRTKTKRASEMIGVQSTENTKTLYSNVQHSNHFLRSVQSPKMV